MEGRVLKYHSGFYHVFHDDEQTICKIRGRLKSGRKNTDIIAIGDLVEFEILPDGSIPQVEVTSCGLNGGPLRGSGTYPASICCALYGEYTPTISNPLTMGT